MTIAERIKSPGPKRILALDGGGIQGVLTLEFLASIENVLRRRSGSPDRFRLCDYFDLIGGTSTGSIIAWMLACGHAVSEIKTLYRGLADEVFKKPFWRLGMWERVFSLGTPILAAVLAIVGGFSQTFQWGAAWQDMVMTAERLEKERDRFKVTKPENRDLAKEAAILNDLVLTESQGFFSRIFATTRGSLIKGGSNGAKHS